MNVKQSYNPNKCREAARNLFTTVSTLIDKAAKTDDHAERHALYLQAMGMSQRAYQLLGKARDINGKTQLKIAKN